MALFVPYGYGFVWFRFIGNGAVSDTLVMYLAPLVASQCLNDSRESPWGRASFRARTRLRASLATATKFEKKPIPHHPRSRVEPRYLSDALVPCFLQRRTFREVACRPKYSEPTCF